MIFGFFILLNYFGSVFVCAILFEFNLKKNLVNSLMPLVYCIIRPFRLCLFWGYVSRLLLSLTFVTVSFA